MADSKGLVYARTDSGNQVDTCSESVLIALRIIDRLTAKPMLLPDDQQHLRTLWLLIEQEAVPLHVLQQYKANLSGKGE